MTIIGIDLGTTFSAVSVVHDGVPLILPVANDNIMPSVVGVSPDGRWLVGQPALNQWTLYPEQTIRSIKRKMGTAESVALGGSAYTPEQISAIILQVLKGAAEEQLGTEVTQAVITVPAYFSDAQRQATRNAGSIAGLEVMRIINEPTAAALAYGMQETDQQIALVYDLGGGTFDVSLVEMQNGVIDVRASHGNTQLGGDDFDERLGQWLIEQFEEKHGVDLRGDRQALARIRRAAEQTKIALSTEPFVWVREEYLVTHRGTPLHLEVEVSRAQFIMLIDDLLHSTLSSVERVLKDGGVERPDHVLLVGGSTYIPAIWDMLVEHVGVTPRQDVNPSEAVALGAGIQGAIIEGQPIDAILVDVTPYSLGIAVAQLTLFGEVTPDRYKTLIRRNSTIPATQREVFNTLHPDQTTVKIEVFQGENPIASQNIRLGDFLFSNLKPAEVGELAEFTVEFNIDVNGILAVRAEDRGSQNEAEITVRAGHERLTHAQIQSAQVDLPGSGEIEVESSLPDEMLREAELLLARAESLQGDEDNPALGEAIEAVESALESDEEAFVRQALDQLLDVLYELEQ